MFSFLVIDNGERENIKLFITLSRHTLNNRESLIWVFFSDTYSGSIGLIITQAINVTGMLQWGIRQSLDLDNLMTSVERILEYTKNVPQEASFESSPGTYC